MTLAVLFCLAAGPLIARPAAPTLEECDARVRAEPEAADTYYCFTRSVAAHGRAEEAVWRLDAILAMHPDRHRAWLNLAFIEERRGSPRADELYRAAAEGAASAGDHGGEVYARLSIGYRASREGRAAEAEEELRRALQAAERSGSRELLGWVRMNQGLLALNRSDHGEARRLYRLAEAMAFPDGNPQLRGRILSGLAAVHWYLGDHATAMAYSRREAEHWRSVGNRYEAATALYNIALFSGRLADIGRIDPAEVDALEREALAAAVEAGNRASEAALRLQVGQGSTGRLAIAEFEKALALSRETDDLDTRLLATRLIAKETFALGPEHRDDAYRLLARALDEARSVGSPYHIARARILGAVFAWQAEPRAGAEAAYLAALDAVERIRNLQPEGGTRARVFSQWVYPYYRFAGHLLTSLAESADPHEDLALAFRVIERMRARVLVDSLDAAGVGSSGPRARDLHAARGEVLERITTLQAELLDPTLDRGRRESALGELEAQELLEADLRDRIARADPVFAALRNPRIAELSEVQDALGEHQALVAFQLPFDRYLDEARAEGEGGAWAVVVTRDGARAFRLPRRHVLEEQVEVFLGLFGRRDGSDAAASTRLFRDLLAEPLAWMPRTVTQLIVVPDEVLHRVPFSALRETEDGAPLATRYRIAHVPSATLWLRWKRMGENQEQLETLAIVNPDLPVRIGSADVAERPAGDWIEGLRLDPLPHARREAKALLAISGRGVLKTGAHASERYLKQADLGRFGVVHFAAHAVVDESHPERSAVVLAPGSDDEDGLLQMREIVDLDLDGKLVILAACRSARGEMLEGEGVLGLARAFFQAGSRAVLASLWAVRDDEAAAVIEEFARRLEDGGSVAEALAAARGARIRAGAPAEAWAGFVILGDGDLVPVPGGRSGVRWRFPLPAALAVLAAALWLGSRRRSR